MGVGEYQARLVRSAAGFDEIRADWQALCEASGAGPFVSYAWIDAWLKTYRSDDVGIFIPTVWQDGALVAAVPFGIRHKAVSDRVRRVRLPQLTMLGDEHVGFHDFLMAPGHEAAMAEAYRACRADADVAYADLTPVRPGAAVTAWLDAARKEGRWIYSRPEFETRIADLSGGAAAFEKRLSANSRKVLRRTYKRLVEAGATFRLARDGSPDAERILDDAIAVSLKSWKARIGTALGGRASDRAFLLNLLKHQGTDCETSVHVCYLGERPIGMAVILRVGMDIFGLMKDYDLDFEQQGVGNAVVWHVAQLDATRGADAFDMLRTTSLTSRFGQHSAVYERHRVALRPSVARVIAGAEAGVRSLVRKVRGDGPRATGRRKFFKSDRKNGGDGA